MIDKKIKYINKKNNNDSIRYTLITKLSSYFQTVISDDVDRFPSWRASSHIYRLSQHGKGTLLHNEGTHKRPWLE